MLFFKMVLWFSKCFFHRGLGFLFLRHIQIRSSHEVQPCPTDLNGEAVASSKKLSQICELPRKMRRLRD